MQHALTNATPKQVNFLLKLNPDLTADELNALSIKEASKLIGKLLKEVKKPDDRTKQNTSKDVKVNIEDLKLKSFTIITDDKTRLKVIQNIYCCDISQSWNNPKESKYYQDKIVLKTSDGMYLTISNSKPSISSVLWFDDETEAPANTFENFKSYNVFHNLRNFKIDLNYNNVIARPNYAKDDNFYEIEHITRTKEYGGFGSSYIRNITDDEKADLQTIYNFQLSQYTKRLETYWKKYSNKVGWCGYWVNR